MNKRLLHLTAGVAIGFVVLAGVIWGLSELLGDREPLYAGKMVYYWSDRVKSAEGAERDEAISVFKTTIYPSLTNEMFADTNDSNLKFTLVGALNKLPGIIVRCLPADARRASAVDELGEFGSLSAAAVPILIDVVNGPDEVLHEAAVRSLGRIGAEPDRVIPLLIGLLNNKDLNAEAAEALGRFGPASKAAVPKMIPMLKLPDKEVRHAVRGALKLIDPTAMPPAEGN